MNKYRLGFDFWGLSLFLLVMIPNFIWSIVPAPNDILRADSITPIIDGIGNVFQIAFIAAICTLIRKDVEKVRLSILIILSLTMVFTYFVGWILYYCSIVSPMIIILLTLTPCMAFVLYTVDRKNVIATISSVIFTICHIIYGFANFIFK